MIAFYFGLDLVADTGLHLHALGCFLRFILLLLLAGGLQGGLTLSAKGSFRFFGASVGVPTLFHRHLRAALVERGDPHRALSGFGHSSTDSPSRVELDIHRGMEALLVGHVLRFTALPST